MLTDLYFFARAFRMHSQRCENRHGQHRVALTKQTEYAHFCARSVNFEVMRPFIGEVPIQSEDFSEPVQDPSGAVDESVNLQLTTINPLRQQARKAPSICKGVTQRYHRYCASRDRPSNMCSTAYSSELRVTANTSP